MESIFSNIGKRIVGKLNREFNHQTHKIVCLLGVSSTGKSHLIKSLIESRQDWTFSPSYTTKHTEKRDLAFNNNIFISRSEFIDQWHNNKLIGVINIHQNYYGQKSDEICKKLDSNNVICILHYSNIKEWKKIFPSTIFIYIIPGDFSKWMRLFWGRKLSPINKILRFINGLYELLTIFFSFRKIDYRIQNDFSEEIVIEFLSTMDKIAN